MAELVSGDQGHTIGTRGTHDGAVAVMKSACCSNEKRRGQIAPCQKFMNLPSKLARIIGFNTGKRDPVTIWKRLNV